MMKNDKDFDINDIYEGMWEYTKYNGKISAVPYNISTPVLYYNAQILKDAGIDVTKAPKTWDELLDYAKKAKTNGNKSNSTDFWGFDTSDAPWTYKALLMQNGNSVVESKGDKVSPLFDNADGIETAAFWRKLVDEKVMPAGQHDLAEKKFLAGNLAMIISSSARMSKWTTDVKFGLGAFPLPSKKKASVPLGGGVLVQFNKSKSEDAATYELIKYLTKKETTTKFSLASGYLPIRKSGLELPETKKAVTENPLYKVAFDQLKDSSAYWHFDEMGTMDQMIGAALEKIEKGGLTPDNAMKSLTADLKKEMGVK
jgi:sn-glycerol 3-phosphate transport system substrate-binding protein